MYILTSKSVYGFACDLEKTGTSEIIKHYQNSTSQKDECYLWALKNSPNYAEKSHTLASFAK